MNEDEVSRAAFDEALAKAVGAVGVVGVARILGVSERRIHYWKSGTKGPSYKHMQAVILRLDEARRQGIL